MESLPVAYEIQMADLPSLTVYQSANAWWLDKTKVIKLVEGFLKGFNVKQSCLWAGITDPQYRYFLKRHPEFYDIKTLCEDLLIMRAKDTIIANIHKPDIAKWFLVRKAPEEFGNARVVVWVCSRCGISTRTPHIEAFRPELQGN